ncbi:GTP-binding protein Rhes [Folsomia candida]|uniref:GTP-binding protein Rhes n=1 Tax=Folsomia candida TaxID=158441 RepID=A0A226DDH5_FOLCA|nr:GTP-binding protein Rhes [Folsomia candida]
MVDSIKFYGNACHLKPYMMGTEEFRVLGGKESERWSVRGGPKVGKSAIVKRFLFNTFQEKYKPTVEDLYSKEYDMGPITLKVDILDTAGDQEFPAMRRLSIATAHAFLLVYSIDDLASFEVVKTCFQEIQEQRADFQEIPIVIAGNKMDVELTRVEVEAKIMECSAKTGGNVREVFRTFLHLAKIPLRQESEEGDCGSGLRRRLSAHVTSGSKSKNRSPSNATTPTQTQPPSPIYGRSSGVNTPTKGPASPSNMPKQSPQFLAPDNPFPFDRNKPRSRSLIRRCSKKVKKQVQDASEGPEGCLLC